MDSPNFTQHVVLYISLPAKRHETILNAYGQKHLAGELNINIRKITDSSESSQVTLKMLRPHSQNTNNNHNNTAATTHLSRTVVGAREKKVLLCKDDKQHSNEEKNRMVVQQGEM